LPAARSSDGVRPCPREPIKRPPFTMRDRQDQDAICVGLEGHNVRETVHHPSARGFRCGAHPRPEWKRVRVSRNPFKNRGHFCQELTAEARALFLVLRSSGTELNAGFRMKDKPHAAARFPSESALAWCPSLQAEAGRRRFHLSDAPTHAPMRPRPVHRAPPDSTAGPPQDGHVRREEVAAPEPGVPPST